MSHNTDNCQCSYCRALYGYAPKPIEAPAVSALRRPVRLADLIDRADDQRKQEKGE